MTVPCFPEITNPPEVWRSDSAQLAGLDQGWEGKKQVLWQPGQAAFSNRKTPNTSGFFVFFGFFGFFVVFLSVFFKVLVSCFVRSTE